MTRKTEISLSRRAFVVAASGAAIAAPFIRSSAWAQGKGNLRIGHVSDLTGFLGYAGYAYDRTLRAAIDKINRAGGIAGRQIEYFLEDTTTTVPVGTRKYRKVVEENNVDFVIGPMHSGIGLALLPLIQELKTVTFLQSEALGVTGKQSNRYTFRLRPNSAIAAHAGANFGVERLGKKWTFVVSDFAYGHATYEDFKPLVEQAGGSVLAKIAVPPQSQDIISFLTQVPKETEVLMGVLVPADGVRFVQQTHEIGLSKRMVRYALWGLIDGVDFNPFKEAIEGMHFIGRTPRWNDQIPESYRKFNTQARDLIGVNPDGTDKQDPSRVFPASYYLSVWSQIHLLKAAVEATGWETKKDNPKLIEYLETASGKASLEYPDGDFSIRREDHQAFFPMVLEQVKNAKLQIVDTIDAKRISYPAPADLRTVAL